MARFIYLSVDENTDRMPDIPTSHISEPGRWRKTQQEKWVLDVRDSVRALVDKLTWTWQGTEIRIVWIEDLLICSNYTHIHYLLRVIDPEDTGHPEYHNFITTDQAVKMLEEDIYKILRKERHERNRFRITVQDKPVHEIRSPLEDND